MNPKKIFAELQRRNVYKVAVAYAVVGWLVVQIATQVFPFFEVPHWAIRMVVIVLLLGFPVALILAWAFELTPEGLVRTEEVEAGRSITRSTGRKLDFIIIGVLLAVIAFLAFQHYGPPRLSGKSIAVLPFVDLSREKDQEYFSDGISEQIINSLSKIHGLFVCARTSAFVFKNKYEDVREVGRVLHVMHVLEGSVSRGVGRVRVDARLIDVTNGYQLWSETYNSGEEDFMSLQNDLAQKVASALQVELHLSESKQLSKPPTYDPEAYDLYLRGRFFLNKRTAESIEKARALFEQAVTKDPRFALGHSGIADSYILLGEYGAISAAEASTRAWPEASAAIAIDDHLAAGYISRAMLLTDFEWNWPAAEADFRKALELDPNSAAARHWYAFHLAEIGRADEALQVIEAAQKLDPISPNIRAAKAKISLMTRRYDEAIKQGREALDLQPNFAPAFSVLAQAYALRGNYPEAIAAAKKPIEQEPGWGTFELAYIYAIAGDKAELEKIMSRVPATTVAQGSPYDRAVICAASRENASALHWLETAIEQRSLEVVWIRVDPGLDNIRAEPGFQKLLARVTPRR
ncbi:MAG: tetratricopeptide repeat protein [Chthoniobacterales bacterium]